MRMRKHIFVDANGESLIPYAHTDCVACGAVYNRAVQTLLSSHNPIHNNLFPRLAVLFRFVFFLKHGEQGTQDRSVCSYQAQQRCVRKCFAGTDNYVRPLSHFPLGRVHNASVSGIDSRKGYVSVEWNEGDETKGKEVRERCICKTVAN